MKRRWLAAWSVLIALALARAQERETLPGDPYFTAFKPLKAPAGAGLLLQKGDRLAICGDSITEQKMYSRMIETYLTVCVPELEVTVRQYGWSGERAPGFLGRMTNDVLRFHPTVATTCYGMNDHRYMPYAENIGREYRQYSETIVRAFKAHGVRVVHGSAGTVGKMPAWVREARGTVDDLNLNLLELRNIGVELCRQEQVAFADVFLPMLVQGFNARRQFGADYMIAGKDGVHPDWAGQAVMAYAFLKALGLNGEIGTIAVDWTADKATATAGHRVVTASREEARIESARYPFCATGPAEKDSSLRSGMALVGFDQQLNRFLLVVTNAPAGRYRVTWGAASKLYSAADLARGVNLAADFEVNPFSQAFKGVDDAVAAKQAYETRQIKDLFHGPEGRADMEATVALTEKTRAPLAAAIRQKFQPVQHLIRIEPE